MQKRAWLGSNEQQELLSYYAGGIAGNRHSRALGKAAHGFLTGDYPIKITQEGCQWKLMPAECEQLCVPQEPRRTPSCSVSAGHREAYPEG